MGKRVFTVAALHVCLLFLIQVPGFGRTEVKYPVAEIPVSLVQNSDMVVRMGMTRFEIHDMGKATKSVRYALSILNQKADDRARIVIGYDPHVSVSKIEARLYNGKGVEVRRLKNSDIKDYSYIQSFSIYEDNRIKYFELNYPEYPYTIEVEYELVYDGILYYPGWMPQDGFRQAVEQSVFEVLLPTGQELRSKATNMPTDLVKAEMGDQVTYRWEVGPLAALEREPLMPGATEVLPNVRIAPARFEYEEFEGDMTSWNAIAQFQNMLNEGRQSLPEETLSKIRHLVKEIDSDTEKIRRIYSYLQENTRYISVQLGIGGWQPFSAEFVDDMGYGDCKALSNYMQALLAAVDIPSYYTLVRAGQGAMNIDKSFPHDQFNHVIVCVPNRGDTLWLECTSQDQPFGFTGRFTGDRDVLVCTDGGGSIVHTPVYRKEENVLQAIMEIDLSKEGNGVANGVISYSGLQYEALTGVADLGVEEQKKLLYSLMDIPSYEINAFRVHEHKNPLPSADLEVNLNLRRYASASGKRIFFKPNMMNRFNPVSTPEKARQFNVVLRYPYMDVDSLIYRVPDNFHLEFLPEPVSLDSRFGSYSSEVLVEQGRIVYVRKISMNKEVFPPEDFEEYVKFINDIAKSDDMKLVLVKST